MHYSFDSLISIFHALGGVIAWGLFLVAAWQLRRAKSAGAVMMLIGAALQVFRALSVLTSFLVVRTFGFGQGTQFLSLIFEFAGTAGIVLFALGLVIHALRQHATVRRLEELERILHDQQSSGQQ
ncbi:MAG: hypothetical protein KGQ89_11800 [Verrucomicrobia bacterium]|nr:hypothetical protein [Verrucomicrobiota bacterium]